MDELGKSQLVRLSFSIMAFDGDSDLALIDSIKYRFDPLGYISAKEKINGFEGKGKGKRGRKSQKRITK